MSTPLPPVKGTSPPSRAERDARRAKRLQTVAENATRLLQDGYRFQSPLNPVTSFETTHADALRVITCVRPAAKIDAQGVRSYTVEVVEGTCTCPGNEADEECKHRKVAAHLTKRVTELVQAVQARHEGKKVYLRSWNTCPCSHCFTGWHSAITYRLYVSLGGYVTRWWCGKCGKEGTR